MLLLLAELLAATTFIHQHCQTWYKLQLWMIKEIGNKLEHDRFEKN